MRKFIILGLASLLIMIGLAGTVLSLLGELPAALQPDPSPTTEAPVASPSTAVSPVAQIPAADTATAEPAIAPKTTPVPDAVSEPALTPVPTPTLTQTPAATRSRLPGERFPVAMNYQRSGHYDQAIEEFQAVLQDGTAEALYPEALYRLGQTRLLAGSFAAAEDSLREFLQQYPGHPHHDHALFLLGEAQEGQGKLQEAAESYQSYLARHPDLVGHVNLRLGGLYAQMDRHEEAIEAYRQGQEAASLLSRRVLYQERVAEILLDQEDFLGAAKEYDSVLDVSSIPTYRCQISYKAGMAYLSADDLATAEARFRAAMDESESSDCAYDSLVQLLDMDATVDEYQRGLIDYYYGAYNPAIAAFTRYLESDATTRQDLALYYMGATYSALGMTAEADRAYQRVIEEFPDSGVMGQAWMARARILIASGDIEGTVQLYDEFMSRYPSSSISATALRQAGLMLYRLGRYPDCATVWEQLSNGNVSADAADEARFWTGKCHMIAGNVETALEQLQRVADRRPLEYYGQRASTMIAAATAGNGAAQTPLLPMTRLQANWEETEQWISEWSGISLEDLRHAIPAEINTEPAFIRARELIAIGLVSEGEGELDNLRARYANQAGHLYNLALELNRWPEPRQTILCSQRLMELSGTSFADTPGLILRLAYPTYYSDLIGPEASDRGVDPLLVYSVIRQESLFQSHATSWVSAQGLMQVMPTTGDWIAGQLGWRNFKHSDLRIPYINIKFGTYYLQQALEMFDGDIVSALAGYNAGPGRAARWREDAGQLDSDLIYALVNISETRLYLQTVLSNYAAYRHIYGISP